MKNLNSTYFLTQKKYFEIKIIIKIWFKIKFCQIPLNKLKKDEEFKFSIRILKNDLFKSYEIGKKSWFSEIPDVYLL